MSSSSLIGEIKQRVEHAYAMPCSVQPVSIFYDNINLIECQRLLGGEKCRPTREPFLAE